MLRRAASLPGRILPVALTIALGSLGGVALATRRGTRAVVSTGLLLLGSSFVWIATSPAFMAYPQIVGQMVLLGLGLTTAPATESILSVLPRPRPASVRRSTTPRGRPEAPSAWRSWAPSSPRSTPPG